MSVMRTARRVIASFLLAACCTVQAQDSGVASPAIDQSLTLVGRDETTIPLPPPPPTAGIVLPKLDETRLTLPDQTPIAPPPAQMSFPLAVPDPRDVLLDAQSR